MKSIILLGFAIFLNFYGDKIGDNSCPSPAISKGFEDFPLKLGQRDASALEKTKHSTEEYLFSVELAGPW